MQSDGCINVQYIDKDRLKTFDAIAPLPDESEIQIQGNAGTENVFFWEASNKAHANGGTTIKGAKYPSNAIGLHRFFFWFESRLELSVTLWFLFNRDFKLVNKFFKMDGKFTAHEDTLPPHAFVNNDNDMDLGLQVRVATLCSGEMEGFDPSVESQPY